MSTATKCRANDPATCTDSNCPEKRAAKASFFASVRDSKNSTGQLSADAVKKVLQHVNDSHFGLIVKAEEAVENGSGTAARRKFGAVRAADYFRTRMRLAALKPNLSKSELLHIAKTAMKDEPAPDGLPASHRPHSHLPGYDQGMKTCYRELKKMLASI